MNNITGVDELQRELDKLSKKLGGKELKKVLRKASKPFIKSAEFKAPKATVSVFRYNTPKLNKKIKAPKGSGVRVARYTPGNLGRSVQVLPFSRKLKRALYVGPKKSRRAKGVFSGKRVDGYYAVMNEYGTKNRRARPFIKSAWSSTKDITAKLILDGLRKVAK